MGPPLAGPHINNKDNYYGVLVKLIFICGFKTCC